MRTFEIPENLLTEIVKALPDNRTDLIDKISNIVKQSEQQERDAAIRKKARDLYTRYKTAPTEAEREQARQAYLDLKGIDKDFRWSKRPE